MSNPPGPLHFVVLALVTIIHLVSCHPAPRTNVLDREIAMELIERGDYGAAIELLTPHLEQAPDDKKTRVVLASAHAARGGVLMKEYADVALGILESARETQRLFDERGLIVFTRVKAQARGETEKNLIDALEKGYRAIWQVSEVIRAFDLLPELTTDAQFVDVTKAIALLDGDPSLEGGPVLYRGLLRLVAFRYRLAHGYPFPEMKECKVDLGELVKILEDMRKELSVLLEDFSKGVSEPTRRQDVENASSVMQEAFDEALSLLGGFRGLGPVDLTSVVNALHGSCR